MHIYKEGFVIASAHHEAVEQIVNLPDFLVGEDAQRLLDLVIAEDVLSAALERITVRIERVAASVARWQ